MCDVRNDGAIVPESTNSVRALAAGVSLVLMDHAFVNRTVACKFASFLYGGRENQKESPLVPKQVPHVTFTRPVAWS